MPAPPRHLIPLLHVGGGARGGGTTDANAARNLLSLTLSSHGRRGDELLEEREVTRYSLWNLNGLKACITGMTSSRLTLTCRGRVTAK